MTHHFASAELRGHGGGAPELHMFRDGSPTVAVLGDHDHPDAQAVANEISAFLAVQEPQAPIQR